MSGLRVVLMILFMVVCVALTALVLMQEGKSAGLSGAISGAAETYFGKNKARTLEGKLERLTKILAAAYLVLALVLYFIVSAIS